ncbi:MAG: VCBS repeat-containing protein, partial [Ardenticatenaceae bacterium]|nr:VCBS repeat-containing protein [Ardenticatenaceae bacterium]
MKTQTRNNLFKLSGLLALALLLVTTSAHATPPIGGPNAAHDQADAAAYASWDNGDNDGFGFGAWTLATSGVNAGHFMGAATGNGDGDTNTDGDIDTGGESWGLWANSGDTAEAVRTFSSALAIGDTFQIDMDNGWIDNTNTVGFGLRNSANENLFEFYFVGGEASYTINDASGPTFTGIGFTDEGLHILFTLTGSDTYRVIVTLVETGVSQTFWGSLMNPAGGQSVAEARLFNANAGNGGTNNAFFNNLHIGTTTTEFVASDIATTADLARSVFAADLDNDGDLDVLSASENDDTIAWYENDGAANPTFTTRVIVTTADGAQSVFAADLDNDGDLDALSASGADDTIAWYENDLVHRNAPFAANSYNVGTSLYDVFSTALGDLDNDGDLDAVAGSFTGTVANVLVAYQNNGTPFSSGAWTQNDIGSTAHGVSQVLLGDLDNDGDLDIVTGSYTREDYEIIVWQNDGTPFGGLWTPNDVGTTTPDAGVWSVALGDLDNDGDLDIVSSSYFSEDYEITAWSNDGTPFSGLWTPNDVGASTQSVDALAIGDLDEDGWLDIVSGNQAGEITAWSNDGTPFSGLWTSNSVGNSVSPVKFAALGDLDNNGTLDIVSGSDSGEDYEVIAWSNDGTPFSGAWTQNDAGASVDSVQAVAL